MGEGFGEDSDTTAVYVWGGRKGRYAGLSVIEPGGINSSFYPSLVVPTLPKAIPADARPPKSRRDHVATAVLLAVYVLVNIATWWGTAAVTTWDSPRYNGGDIFLFLNPGIPPTILFSAFPDANAATFVQVVLYAAAWSSLAGALLASLRSTWIKWPLAVLVLVMSLTTPLWSWNLVVGSEGLTVIAMVAWISTFVWMAASSRTSALAWNFLAASALLITRPQALIFVLPIQFVATVWWMRREQRSLFTMRGVLAGLGIVLIASTGWATYRILLLANDDVYSFRYALHNLVEKTPSFREYVLNEAPPCEAIPAALNGPQPWTDVIAFDNTLISLCPETFIWFKSDAVSPQSWILYDPAAAVINFRDVMWGIALPVGTEKSALPGVLDDALLPGHNLWLPTGVALLVGLGLGALGRVRYSLTPLGITGVVVVVASIGTYLFAVWAADGYDVIRHMVPVTPLLPIAALALPAGLTGRK